MEPFPEYEQYDAMGLAQLVRDKQVSPAELVEAALARIRQHNPKLNAVVHQDVERAKRFAASVDSDAALAGVPFLLKDLHAEEVGQPCTESSRFMAEHRADFDANLVRRHRAAGLNVLGRTNTPEFGIMGITESALRGPCRNPWNLDHTPGGSSGGSGAAVAARIVPVAHAGDGGGSIRIPASACGLVGLKPTRARTPMGPKRGEGWNGFVVEHVLSRTVRDSAKLLDLTEGPDVGAAYEVRAPERPFIEEVGADAGRLKIAFTTDALLGDRMDASCVEAVRDAAKLCEALGHDVVEAKPDYERAPLVVAYLRAVAASIAAHVEDVSVRRGRRPRWDELEAETWLFAHIGRVLRASEYLGVLGAVERARRSVGRFFCDYDVLITSTWARAPMKIGENATKRRELAMIRALCAAGVRKPLLAALDAFAPAAFNAVPNTQLFNMTGQPAVSLPLHEDGGLPIGVQFVGRFGDEATLFRLASQIEAERPWIDRMPPMLDA